MTEETPTTVTASTEALKANEATIQKLQDFAKEERELISEIDKHMKKIEDLKVMSEKTVQLLDSHLFIDFGVQLKDDPNFRKDATYFRSSAFKHFLASKLDK